MISKTINLPDELNFSKFEKDFLKKFSEAISTNVNFHKIVFEFRETKWVDLMEIMCLSVAADHLIKEKKCKCRFNFPKEGYIKDFLQAWNLINVLSIKGSSNLAKEIFPQERYKVSRFIPVKSIEGEDNLVEIKRDIAEKLRMHFPEISSEEIESLCNKIYYEVCKNILDHAYDKKEKNKTALIGMRRYSNLISEMKSGEENERKKAKSEFLKLPFWMRELMGKEQKVDCFLELVVIDGGKGFLENLKKELWEEIKKNLIKNREERDPLPQEINDENVLRLVFLKGGLSTHPDKEKDPRRGYGLYWMREHVNVWGGCIYVRTGKCAAIISSDSEPHYEERKNDFPGVQYRIFLPLSYRSGEVKKVEQRQKQWEQEKIKTVKGGLNNVY